MSSEISSDIGLLPESPSGRPNDPLQAEVGAQVARIEALFREEHPRVVAYLAARTGSWAEARDVAAQAFTRMLEMRDLGSVNSLKAYLYTIAQNIVKDRQKLAAIRRRIHQSFCNELPTTSPPPEPLLSSDERLNLLQNAIESLRPVWREALTMRYWDRLEVSEMVIRFAERGVAVNKRTVERWLHEAIAECRRRIRAAEGEEVRQ